ncbi:Short-chain-enoyl-CoA hydratase [Usitatibacter rugosus]|uniref:Short-chain-enoyl-CoA hydratase n=1 Tax=Usitatibacter rugosus TaxID=2732067 RepID=A0A6M4GTZ4_9PROT|nr:enoyl-CoA hydratase [Usitatibacter rugosus]QJR10819.1 Short-chain-enoyl-CoA hydratase [Usitatibacter rugosus]
MIRHEIRGHTAFLTIDNPPANTWTPESLRVLEKLIGELNDNRDVYAAVITGAGTKFFSAGADLKTFSADKVLARHFIACFGSAFEALMNARFVTVSAINGYAMGGGLECALATDIRIAESHAQMALPEPAVGLLPAGSGTQNLPWLVGEAWAKRIILTNERVDAATAVRIGLVQEVVEKGEGLAKATEIAERVATLSPRAVEYCKSLIHNARNGIPRRAGLSLERERFMDLFDHSDQQEGVAAFLEKRKPEWKND